MPEVSRRIKQEAAGASDQLRTVFVMYRKRHRTTFSQQQLSVLEEAFKQNIYPSPSLREAIALQTNLDASRVQVWFQNRRAKHKRQVSQVNQVIRSFSYTSSDPTATSAAPSATVASAAAAAAAALEAALSGDDFCIADQIIADCCTDQSYEDGFDQIALNHSHSHSHNQHHQPLPPLQQQQQQHNLSQPKNNNNNNNDNDNDNINNSNSNSNNQQPSEQSQVYAQQSTEQQRQQSHHDHERQNQYYNYYRQQIGSLKSTMTEFLQS